MSPTRTQYACDQSAASELRDQWRIPLITAQVVDLMDAEQFPELALAREHARQMKEARNG